jgi:hypothetical protein
MGIPLTLDNAVPIVSMAMGTALVQLALKTTSLRATTDEIPIWVSHVYTNMPSGCQVFRTRGHIWGLRQSNLQCPSGRVLPVVHLSF